MALEHFHERVGESPQSDKNFGTSGSQISRFVSEHGASFKSLTCYFCIIISTAPAMLFEKAQSDKNIIKKYPKID